ncbi:hypothetical protein AVEN_125444-1 [Araneus ventricosus]|uniref:Uncharacterized protein n=1 Tax=Araneus ventricosus TaxID=182803 RepID=A0A4Y2M7H2_ARAVE|nr:hypothetical protein AVEN_125444-1 [Araneus ventricosus]
MDGCTKGRYSYSGAIGLLPKDCEKSPVVKFDEIDCILHPLDLKDIKKLSTVQQYLYRICLDIKDGSCSSSVTDNSPGKLSHARWLTTANRLLRLYIGAPSPSQNLIILVKAVSYNAYTGQRFQRNVQRRTVCSTTFEEFPCHTQPVGRCVRLISEAAMNVCGEAARDGYIRAKLQARKELPTFEKGQCYSNT